MRDALVARYQEAVASGTARGVAAELGQLETMLGRSCASINLEPKIVRNLAMGQAYRSYYEALDRGDREIAKRQHHGHRAAVDAKIHTGYEEKIVNAALSPDGRGLPNYGEIALLLKDSVMLDRGSVLRENSFEFYKRFSLGDMDAVEEAGWRSSWADRALLVIAVLEPQVQEGMSSNELADLVLHSSEDRHHDRYIEAHLFDSLVREYVRAFYLAKTLKPGQDELDWQFIVEKLTLEDAELLDNPHV